MAGYLKVIAVGTLGADSELRYSQSGTAVLSWRMACTTSRYNGKTKEREESTEWVSCVLFGKLGESLAPRLQKGVSVFVDGTLRTDSYEKNGEKRYRTQVVVNEVIIQGGASREQSEPRAPAPRQQAQKPESKGPARPPVTGQAGADYGDNGPPSSIPF